MANFDEYLDDDYAADGQDESQGSNFRLAEAGHPYRVLIGHTVDSVEVFESDWGGEEWHRVHLVAPDGSRLAFDVSRDSEGNGPGVLFIYEVPK